MVGRFIRTAVLAASVRNAGLRIPEQVERRLAGGRALSVRGKIAHRAVLVRFFSALKQLKQQSQR